MSTGAIADRFIQQKRNRGEQKEGAVPVLLGFSEGIAVRDVRRYSAEAMSGFRDISWPPCPSAVTRLEEQR